LVGRVATRLSLPEDGLILPQPRPDCKSLGATAELVGAGATGDRNRANMPTVYLWGCAVRIAESGPSTTLSLNAANSRVISVIFGA